MAQLESSAGEDLLARLLNGEGLAEEIGEREREQASDRAKSRVSGLVTVVGAEEGGSSGERDVPSKLDPPTALLARIEELLPKLRQANEKLPPSDAGREPGEVPEEIVDLFDGRDGSNGQQHVEMDVFLDPACGELAPAQPGRNAGASPRQMVTEMTDNDESDACVAAQTAKTSFP